MTNHNAALQTAADLLQSFDGQVSTSQTEIAVVAHACATTALAYEQQTANLIAYQANVELSYIKVDGKKPRSDGAEKLNATIIERLGLA